MHRTPRCRPRDEGGRAGRGSDSLMRRRTATTAYFPTFRMLFPGAVSPPGGGAPRDGAVGVLPQDSLGRSSPGRILVSVFRHGALRRWARSNRFRVAGALALVIGSAGTTFATGGTAFAAAAPTAVVQARASGLPPDPFCVHTCGPFVFNLIPSIVLPPDVAEQIRGQLATGFRYRQEAGRSTDPVVVARFTAASNDAFSQAESLFRDTRVSPGAATRLGLCSPPAGGRTPNRNAFEAAVADGLTALGSAHLERDPVRAASLQASAARSLDTASAIGAACYA